MESNAEQKEEISFENLTESERESAKRDLILLIYKFLNYSGLENTSKALEREIQDQDVLPMRVDLSGQLRSMPLSEVKIQYEHVRNSHLLDSLARSVKELCQTGSQKYVGLTSFLSAQYPSCKTRYENSMSVFSTHTNIMANLVKRNSNMHMFNRQGFSHNLMHQIAFQKRIVGHLASTFCVLFDRRGEIIITGSDDRLIKIWDSRTGTLVATLRGHSGEICDIAINADNSLLASGSCDKTVRIWCTKTGASLYVLQCHLSSVTSVKFSSTSVSGKNCLISTGNDGYVCVWFEKNSTFPSQPIIFNERLRSNSQIACSSISPGGYYLAAGSSDAHIYIYCLEGNPSKVADLEDHDDRVDTLEFSHSGEKFLSASKDGTARIWSLRTTGWYSISLSLNVNKIVEEETNWPKFKVTTVSWTKEDTFVVGSVNDHTIVVWSPETGEIVSTLKGHTDSVFVIEPNSVYDNILLTAGHDGMIFLWDLDTFDAISILHNKADKDSTSAIFDCKMSTSEFRIASTDSDGQLCIYGIGSTEMYDLVPDQQFFHTDYRPTIFENGKTYDEQTGLEPHQMSPPFLVNIDGEPHPPKYQLLCLPSVFFKKNDIDEKEVKSNDPATQTLSERSVGNVEGVRQIENINSGGYFTDSEYVRWKNRPIILPLSGGHLNEVIAITNEIVERESSYYNRIKYNSSENELKIGERKARLMSLKSKAIRRALNEQANNLAVSQPVAEENSMSTITSDASSSYYSESEETQPSDTDYISFDSSSECKNRVEICTRRRKYTRKVDSISSSDEAEEDDLNSIQPVYPHLIQNFTIPSDWFLSDPPFHSPFIPQIGDIVVYLVQVHRIYINHVTRNKIYPILTSKLCYNKTIFNQVEVCRVSNITYYRGYPYLCSVNLTKLDASGTYSTGMNFNVQFTDISNIDDFLLLKQTYDRSIQIDWNKGDLFKCYIDKNWWEGVVVEKRPLDEKLPHNYYRSIVVSWNTGETDTLSPWDIFPLDFTEDHVEYITEDTDWSPESKAEERQRILNGLETISHLPHFETVESILHSQSESVAYPANFSTIIRRLSSNVYRRKKAIAWELRQLLFNLKHINMNDELLKLTNSMINAMLDFLKDACPNIMDLVDRTPSLSHNDAALDLNTQLNGSFSEPEFKWLGEARNLIIYLTGLSDSQPFISPINLETYPDYLNFVQTPMDFETLMKNLMAGNYLSPDTFVRDLKLIFNNSRDYNTNPRSAISGMTIRMSKVVNKKIQDLFPQWKDDVLNNKTRLTRHKISSYLQSIENIHPLTTTILSPIKPKSRSRGVNLRSKVKRDNYSDSLDDIPTRPVTRSRRLAKRLLDSNSIDLSSEYNNSTSPCKKKKISINSPSDISITSHDSCEIQTKRYSLRSSGVPHSPQNKYAFKLRKRKVRHY